MTSQTAFPLPKGSPQKNLGGAEDSDGTKYIRLPVESAKQLRWYDQKDIRLLIDLHLREKHELLLANAALREALQRNNIRNSAISQINEPIDRLISKDDAVSDFLVLAARNEIDQLRQEMTLLKAGENLDEEQLPDQNEATDTRERIEPLDSSPKEQEGSISANAEAYKDLVAVAQSAQYEAETARAVAEEQLEKFQTLSAAQQKEIDDLCQSVDSKTDIIQKLNGKIGALEKELKQAVAKNNESLAASKKEADVSSQISILENENKVLRQNASQESERSRVLQQRAQANEAALSRANAELSHLEAIISERDELRSKVSYFESLISDLKSADRADQAVHQRLKEAEHKFRMAEEELVNMAKVAASLEQKLEQSKEEIELKDIQIEKCEIAINNLRESAEEQMRMQWEECGTDHSKWPPIAKEEMCLLETRLQNLQNVINESEKNVLEVQKQCDALKSAVNEANERAETEKLLRERLKAFSESQIQRLESAALLATHKADDLMKQKNRLESEMDRMRSEIMEQAPHLSKDLPTNSSVDKNGCRSDTDMIYLKNVVIKYIDCCLGGRFQECQVLLPVISTTLRTNPSEQNQLKEMLDNAQSFLNWMPLQVK